LKHFIKAQFSYLSVPEQIYDGAKAAGLRKQHLGSGGRHLCLPQVVRAALLSRDHGSPLQPGTALHFAQLRLFGQLPVPLGTFIEYYTRFY